MSDVTKRYLPFITYYNFAEYVVPALLLLVLMWLNAWILLEVSVPNPLIVVPPVFFISVMTLGWIMYISRFYHLFPLYRSIKRKALVQLGDIFPEEQERADVDAATLGKYVFRQHWKVVDDKEKREALKLHANWVFLVHTSNILMIFLAVVALVLGLDAILDISLVKGELIKICFLVGFEFAAFIYFFLASVNKMKESNKNIRFNVHKKRIEIGRRIPVNDIKNLME